MLELNDARFDHNCTEFPKSVVQRTSIHLPSLPVFLSLASTARTKTTNLSICSWKLVLEANYGPYFEIGNNSLVFQVLYLVGQSLKIVPVFSKFPSSARTTLPLSVHRLFAVDEPVDVTVVRVS
ncbi:hypothetical protein FBUS_09402 [Fasciolopsis buskii]|uniref:Uncharacterized protein n=1 Tax=Fasciolopsis buskii TaxID=27845 RepID=A0A8E0S111_9TREM|nr:hypothetical protein FBUS_09402 [Fasciolopsis buski]